MPKPPPFHAVRSVVRASAICASATTVSMIAGTAFDHSARRVTTIRLQDDDSIAGRHSLIVRAAALAIRDAADAHAGASARQRRDDDARRWRDDLIHRRA